MRDAADKMNLTRGAISGEDTVTGAERHLSLRTATCTQNAYGALPWPCQAQALCSHAYAVGTHTTHVHEAPPNDLPVQSPTHMEKVRRWWTLNYSCNKLSAI